MQQKRRSRNDSNGSLHAVFAGTLWRPNIKKRDGLILVPSHQNFDFLESFVCSYYEVYHRFDMYYGVYCPLMYIILHELKVPHIERNTYIHV